MRISFGLGELGICVRPVFACTSMPMGVRVSSQRLLSVSARHGCDGIASMRPTFLRSQNLQALPNARCCQLRGTWFIILVVCIRPLYSTLSAPLGRGWGVALYPGLRFAAPWAIHVHAFGMAQPAGPKSADMGLVQTNNEWGKGERRRLQTTNHQGIVTPNRGNSAVEQAPLKTGGLPWWK